jgi:hypothetical protein
MKASGRIERAIALLSCLLGLAFLPDANACMCRHAGPFEQVEKSAQVVAHVVVLEHRGGRRPGSMVVEVINAARNARFGERIVVWGDPGNLCRPYISTFPVGTQWILALGGGDRFVPTELDQGRRQFAINGCGEYWIRVRGQSVTGKSKPLSDFLLTIYGVEDVVTIDYEIDVASTLPPLDIHKLTLREANLTFECADALYELTRDRARTSEGIADQFDRFCVQLGYQRFSDATNFFNDQHQTVLRNLVLKQYPKGPFVTRIYDGGGRHPPLFHGY